MKRAIALTAMLMTAAAAATDSPESLAHYQRTKAACAKVKSYPAFKKEVTENYDKAMPKVLGGYLPGGTKDGNAAYVFVNPKQWDEMSPKDQISITDAAYMVEVCNPQSTAWPVLLIADWKTQKPLATRKAWRVTGWLGR